MLQPQKIKINPKFLILSLGSNLNDPAYQLRIAFDLISLKIGKIIAASSYYRTQPWGFETDKQFINRVIVVEVTANPIALLKKLKHIEQKMGRNFQKSEGYQSRNIDIDILFYGERFFQSDFLTIPHEKIKQRRFILQPLTEIFPDFVFPGDSKTFSQLLDICKDELMVEKIRGYSIPFDYIHFEGNIGAGKTTLLQFFLRELAGYGIYEEFEDNPFLKDFYASFGKNAFLTELHFFLARVDQIKNIKFLRRNAKLPVFFDYAIEKSKIFAEINLRSKPERQLFEKVFNTIDHTQLQKRKIIFLQHDVKYLWEKIVQRGRKIEKNISKTYIEKLNDVYENFDKKNDLSIQIQVSGFHNRIYDLFKQIIEQLEP